VQKARHADPACADETITGAMRVKTRIEPFAQTPIFPQSTGATRTSEAMMARTLALILMLASICSGCHGDSLFTTPTDLNGQPVTIRQVTLGQKGGIAEIPGTATVEFPASSLPDNTSVTMYTDSSPTMHDVFQSGADVYLFSQTSTAALVVGLSTDPMADAPDVTVRFRVSDNLVAAFRNGNTPHFLYYTGQPADPDENGNDFYQFIPVENVTFDGASRLVIATVPIEAFAIEHRYAIFVVAADSDAMAAQRSTSLNPSGSPEMNPLGNTPLVIQGGFGEWRDTKKASYPHAGLDFRTIDTSGNAAGLPVYAVADSTIISVKVSACAPVAGKAVLACVSQRPMLSLLLRLADGTVVAYRHLTYGSVTGNASNDCATAIAGADLPPDRPRRPFWDVSNTACVVRKGWQIAVSGNTGTDAWHLHFERSWKGRLTHPLPAMSKINVERLNPASFVATGTVSLAQEAPANAALFVGPTLRTEAQSFTSAETRIFRLSLVDSTEREITIRRKKSPPVFLPITAEWQPLDPGSTSRVVALNTEPSGSLGTLTSTGESLFRPALANSSMVKTTDGRF
jgi:murein DD-endopeptidase MepM/ murein hydrolase activator NlpD